MRLGVLKTRYAQHRADSGRLSSGVNPSDDEKKGRKVQQVQNIPKVLRDIVVAPPGFVFVAADWSGIEWALMMWFARKHIGRPVGFHKDVLKRYQQREFDPHCWLAATAYGQKYEELLRKHKAGEKLPERQLCKPYTHGYTYDGAPVSLARNAGHADAVGIRVCKAHDTAFKLRELKEWLVALVRGRRYAETPLGWRRYFWEWQPKSTEILAHYGQGTGADLCKTSLNELWTRLRPRWRVVTTTHDSIMLMVPSEDESAAREVLVSVMQRAIDWLDGWWWPVDVKTGQDWRAVS